MKNIFKVLISGILLVLISACDGTNLDIQDDPNSVSADQASVNDLYNNIQLVFANVILSLDGGLNTGAGAMARMYYAGGNFGYQNITSPNSFNGLWFNTYSELFPDVEALIDLADERRLDIHAGSAMIMKAYSMMGLVDMLGNVPNIEAGQGTNLISPNADSGESVYAASLDLLDQAIDRMSGSTSTGPVNDLFYGGSAEKWIRLAKTLKLRAAVTKRKIDPAGSTTEINALIAEGDIISDIEDDFQGRFGSQRSNPNSRHPFYNNHYETGDGTYLSNYFMWLLRSDKVDEDGNEVVDPRIRYYFYRKVDNSLTQNPTTYSCHLSAGPTPSSRPAHFIAIDPRLPYCVAHADGYSGRDHLNGSGTPPDGPVRTSFGLYPGGGQFDDESFQDTRQAGTTGGLGQGIIPIVLSSYVDFLRAEAALTIGTNDDARTLLESAIRKSMDKVEGFESLVPGTMAEIRKVRETELTVKELYGLNEDRVDAYVQFVLAQFDSAANEDKKLDILMKEYYIALWGNGHEAYNLYRRTGKPDNMMPGLEASVGDFIRTFFLPDVHVNRNANAIQKSLTDLVFWDDGSQDLY